MPGSFAEPHEIHAISQTDAAIAALAGQQYGVISRAQLRDLGLGRGAIEHRLRRHLLHRVHARVYAVGHAALSREAVWMAAVLAAGERAVLSHWSAASLWALRPGAGPLTHVTVPRRRGNISTVEYHYAVLPDDEVTERHGIPVTAPARVVLDLAPRTPVFSLRRAVERCERLRPWVGPSIPEILDRYPARAGTPRLRAIVGRPLAMTRSDLEARFVELLDEWDLPRPRTNVNVAGFEVDCVWPDHGLVVEIDGFESHRTRAAFERDRARDRVLQAAGWTVVRITWRQLVGEPDALRADLARLLGGRS